LSPKIQCEEERRKQKEERSRYCGLNHNSKSNAYGFGDEIFDFYMLQDIL